jgi:hypothetical protein
MSVHIVPRSETEYHAGLPDRIHEEELEIGELYTAFFALKTRKLQAVQFPIIITSLAVPIHGAIEFAGLDTDLRQATKSLVVEMSSGLTETKLTVHPHGSTRQGYFMGYQDDFDDLFMLEAAAERHLTSA